LVQGEVLTYPLHPELVQTPVNYAWLKFTKKLDDIGGLLAAQSRRDPDPMHGARIRKKLQDGTLTLGDLGEPSVSIGGGKTWMFVPVPMRLDTMGNIHPREQGLLYIEIMAGNGGNSTVALTQAQSRALHLVSGLL